VVDVACGHGELLLRAAERAAIAGVGLDLSPWVLLRARAGAAERVLRGTVEWWLGEGMALPAEVRWDIASCVGASWIWHGFSGTAKALARRLRPGGRVAVGDLRARPDVDVDGAALGVITEAEQLRTLQALGLTPIAQIVAPDEAWAAYHELVIESADGYEGPARALDAGALAREWMADFERDRRILEWTVWVAEKR
jgi:SAM-dependent methyltransferase